MQKKISSLRRDSFFIFTKHRSDRVLKIANMFREVYVYECHRTVWTPQRGVQKRLLMDDLVKIHLGNLDQKG